MPVYQPTHGVSRTYNQQSQRGSGGGGDVRDYSGPSSRTVKVYNPYQIYCSSLGPSLYWQMEEASGTVVADFVGQNPGTVTSGFPSQNAASLIPPFSGPGSYFQLGNNIPTTGGVRADTYKPYVAGSQRTLVSMIACWGATPAWTVFSGSGVLGGASNFPHPTLELFPDSSGLNMWEARFYATVNTFPFGFVDWGIKVPISTTQKPVMIALTFDDSTSIAELFVNGASHGTRGPLGTFDVPLHFDTIGDPGFFQVGYRGSGSASETADGWFDEVAVFERILSATEIANMATLATVTPYDLVPYLVQRPLAYA